MKRYFLQLFFIFLSITALPQVDYSSSWEDYFSYTYITDFYQDEHQIMALTENALFRYDKNTNTYEKFSSINGLSGSSTSAFYYSDVLKKTIIGYQNGLIEVIDKNKKVFRKSEIINFNISGSKVVSKITPLNDNQVLLAMPFGIVLFNLNTLEFGSTYFIGNNSSEVIVNDIILDHGKIYAATPNGIYVAQADNPYLIDYHNWTLYNIGNCNNLCVFNNDIYVGINSNLYQLNDDFTTTYLQNFWEPIVDITSDSQYLSVTTQHSVKVLNANLLLMSELHPTTEYFFYSHTAKTYGNKRYVATNKFGILESDITDNNHIKEIYPNGPLYNSVFDITAAGNHLWIVFGAYDANYAPTGKTEGISHFNGETWTNIPYKDLGVNYNDLVHVTTARDNSDKAYVSSWGKGMLVIENNQVTHAWNAANSGLPEANFTTDTNKIRLSGSVFDSSNNLWIGWLYNKIIKYSNSGQWTTYDLSSVISPDPGYGIREVTIDKTNNKWMATAKNGALVFNENGNKMLSINASPTKGKLPSEHVTSVAVDKNNRVWIGTISGLRYIDSSANIFDLNLANNPTKAVVIVYEDQGNIGEALLGNQRINSICVDGADNKWFGTESSGVLCTDYSGTKALYQFDITNSPLPSNKVIKIQFEPLNGKIFFATDKGVVAFKSNIAPYGDHLEEIYAYPNPVKNNHDTVTIAGRNGSTIPYGTNVKILDASGKLVYETNVKEGQEDFGGKVVWNKTNLAGNKVASGVYIVMMYYKDQKETATAKIAIIN